MPQAFFVLMRKLCNFSFSILILCASLSSALCGPALQAEGSHATGLLASGQTQSASASATSSNPVKLSAVDAVIQQAIADNNIPGAVVVVGHDGKVIYRKAYGHRSLEPKRELMTLDTIFDLASLTKVIATTTAVMQVMEPGKVRMNDPVAKYIPEFAQNGHEDITIRQLLTHYSGLAPDLDVETAWEGEQAANRRACVTR